MADPQSIPGSGAIAQDKDMKSGLLESSDADGVDKLGDEAVAGKDQPQSMMPTTGSGATGSGAPE